MNDDKKQDVNALSTAEVNAKLEADETAELKRELTDDEIALIAGGMVGTNETHTKSPT